MCNLYPSMKFHHSVETAITYTIESINRQSSDVVLSYIDENQNKVTTSYFLPIVEKFFNEGTWIAGIGSDRMMIKLIDGYLGYKSGLEGLQGQWLEVETEYLFDNQYNTKYGRIPDRLVQVINNDQRPLDKNIIFHVWGGVRPKLYTFDHLVGAVKDGSTILWDNDNKYFPENFQLEFVNGTYYRYTNNSRSESEFLYKGGVFYEIGIGFKAYRKLPNVSQKGMIALRKFFEEHYKG